MKQASDFFHAEDNLNCAQSVLKYFDAPAALLGDDRKFAELCSEFAARTEGALTCKELKGEVKFPCPACVNLAATLVEKYKEK